MCVIRLTSLIGLLGLCGVGAVSHKSQPSIRSVPVVECLDGKVEPSSFLSHSGLRGRVLDF